jgi:hypothetical protein
MSLHLIGTSLYDLSMTLLLLGSLSVPEGSLRGHTLLPALSKYSRERQGSERSGVFQGSKREEGFLGLLMVNEMGSLY